MIAITDFDLLRTIDCSDGVDADLLECIGSSMQDRELIGFDQQCSEDRIRWDRKQES